MQKKHKIILAAIIFLAIFFRFYQISQLPGGLFPDEAANGLDINQMQQGHLQPFYERGNGREALFFYMLWGSVEAFGKGPWQHHIVSSLIGALSVILCFMAARRIFLIGEDEADEQKQDRAAHIALLSAFLMAVSTWHIVLSRTAFRAVTIPLFSALTFYLMIRAFQAIKVKQRLLWSFLAGASFALGFYTYIAYRIMVPAVAAAVLWPLFAAIKEKIFFEQIKRFFWPGIFFATAFIAVIFPLAKYFYEHPGSFVGRAGQVSVFNPELYTYNGEQLHGKPPIGIVLQAMLEVGKTQLAGFFVQGDLNWRSNISGMPFLSVLYSPFFGFGLLLVTFFGAWYFFAPSKRKSFWKYFLLAVWFWGMLLPVVTTAEGIPHGLRAIGVIPAVFIISAWALYGFSGWFMRMHRKIWDYAMFHYKDPSWLKNHSYEPPQMVVVNAALKIVVVVFVAALVSQAYFAYFVEAANSPENFYYFRSDLVPVSRYLTQRCNKEHTYLILDKFSVQTTDYLTSDPKGNFANPCNVPYVQVDPEDSWRLKNLAGEDQVVFTQSSMFDAKKFKLYHPDFRLVLEFRNKFGQSIMAVYEKSQKNN